MKRLTSYAVTTIVLVSSLAAWAQLSPGVAQNTLRAAAVVNDEIISMFDLAMRTRLAILASGILSVIVELTCFRRLRKTGDEEFGGIISSIGAGLVDSCAGCHGRPRAATRRSGRR